MKFIENETEFLIRNPKTIFNHVYDVYSRRCVIYVYFGSHYNCYLSCITAVDRQKNQITFDCAPSEELNRELLASKTVQFVANLEGIKICFEGFSISQQTDNINHASFVMPLPKEIIWLQRRESYRVKLPMSSVDGSIEFLITQHHEPRKPLAFKITDISMSGFSFTNDAPELAEFLLPPAAFKNAALKLDDKAGTSARISFKIININSTEANKFSKTQRVGCIFTQIPKELENDLQSFIRQIEISEIRAKSN